jgi:hypothetical protein
MSEGGFVNKMGDKMKAFGVKMGVVQPPEPETLPQQLLRQVDEATTLSWKQVKRGSSPMAMMIQTLIL